MFRLQYTARALTPISHSEGVSGNETLYRTEEIIDEKGVKLRIPMGISGNAMKHMLRASGARFMIECMGLDKIASVDVIHLLFSGGPKMNKSAKFVLADAREICRLCPIVSALGYSAGNHMETSKVEISDMMLFCAENQRRTPDWVREKVPFETIEDADYYRSDRMIVRRNALSEPIAMKLLPEVAQLNEEASARKASGSAKSAKEAKGESTQMIATVQTLAPGTWFWGEIIARNLTELERWAIMSALYYASIETMDGGVVMNVGGKRSTGFGRVCFYWTSQQAELPRAVSWDDSKMLVVNDGSGLDKLRQHYQDNKTEIMETLEGVYK